jgi:phage-related tail protein
MKMTMSHDEITSQTVENTEHIKDIRDAFQLFKDREFKKFKENLTLLIAAGGILWYLAMFVFNTKSGTENNHNDIILQSKEFDKKFEYMQKRQDENFRRWADSSKRINSDLLMPIKSDINDIKHQLKDHAISLKALSEKQLHIDGWVTEHKSSPTSNPTLVPVH